MDFSCPVVGRLELIADNRIQLPTKLREQYTCVVRGYLKLISEREPRRLALAALGDQVKAPRERLCVDTRALSDLPCAALGAGLNSVRHAFRNADCSYIIERKRLFFEFVDRRIDRIGNFKTLRNAGAANDLAKLIL